MTIQYRAEILIDRGSFGADWLWTGEICNTAEEAEEQLRKGMKASKGFMTVIGGRVVTRAISDWEVVNTNK